MAQTPEEKRAKQAIYNAKYHAKHCDELNARCRQWQLDNPERVKANADKRYARDGEAMREAARLRDHANRAADPEGERAKVRARYAANPEPTLERCRTARAENPELFAAQEKARRAADPAKHSIWDKTKRRRRRARLAEAPVIDLTHEQWEEVLIAKNYRCEYCKPNCWWCIHKKHALAQDHISPLGPTGSHTLHNVVPVCKSCNSRKGRKEAPVPAQPLLLTTAPSKPMKRRGV